MTALSSTSPEWKANNEQFTKSMRCGCLFRPKARQIREQRHTHLHTCLVCLDKGSFHFISRLEVKYELKTGSAHCWTSARANKNQVANNSIRYMYVRYALRRFKAWFVPLCGTLRMSNIAISQCCSYAACLSANCACSNLQLLCARHLNATHTEAGRGTPSHTHTDTQQIWWNFYGTINVRLCVCVRNLCIML